MLTYRRLREVLHYNPETGLFTWLITLCRKIRIGSVAGTNSQGYIRIQIDGRPYLAHRLAWLYVHGKWPTSKLDHYDCCPANNWIDNLRLATNQQNRANVRNAKNNTSGFKGVSWDGKNCKWLAQIKVNRRSHFLGHFLTPQAAHAAYCSAAQKHFGGFARFA